MKALRRRIYFVFTLLILVQVVGTSGFMIIEGWTFLDSLYMSVITLSTVGFGEIQPLSTTGRLFTIALIILGVTTVTYSVGTLAEYLIAAGITLRIKRRQLMRDLSQLKEHIILCGYGRVGFSIAAALHENGRQFVVVDLSADVLEQVELRGWLGMQGDATQDEVLLAAGIKRAWGLLVCTADDADNLYIVLSARALNPDLFIVARSTQPSAEAKIRLAGADRVVSPYSIGGKHMAGLALRPHVTEFLDVVTLHNGLELWLEEIQIHAGSSLAGKTVFEADIRRQTGVTLIALIRFQGGQTLQPDMKTRLEVGDELIVLGTRKQLQMLEEMAGIGN